jgi:hypothetical protein
VHNRRFSLTFALHITSTPIPTSVPLLNFHRSFTVRLVLSSHADFRCNTHKVASENRRIIFSINKSPSALSTVVILQVTTVQTMDTVNAVSNPFLPLLWASKFGLSVASAAASNGVESMPVNLADISSLNWSLETGSSSNQSSVSGVPNRPESGDINKFNKEAAALSAVGTSTSGKSRSKQRFDSFGLHVAFDVIPILLSSSVLSTSNDHSDAKKPINRWINRHLPIFMVNHFRAVKAQDLYQVEGKQRARPNGEWFVLASLFAGNKTLH